ncbi:MAG: type IV secretory system conjugative DNA transfer family protein [Pseudomonadota bacterium]
MPLLFRTVIFTGIGFAAAFAYLLVLSPWWNFQFAGPKGEPTWYMSVLIFGLCFVVPWRFLQFVRTNTRQKNSVEDLDFSMITLVCFGMYVVLAASPIIDDETNTIYTDAIAAAIFYAAPALIIFMAVSSVPAMLSTVSESPTYRRWFGYGRGHNALWARLSSFKALETIFHKDKRRYIDGIFLGRTLYEDDLARRYISLTDETHHITIAQSGAGKTISAVWPNLAYYSGPKVVLDPKGEHAQFSIKTLRMGGIVLDPYGNTSGVRTACFNPLTEIDIANDNARGFIQAISDGCVLDEAGDTHFVESCRTVIEGLIAHVLSRHPEENHTLPFVADLLKGYNPELGVADPDIFDRIIEDMTTNDAAGGLPMEAASVLVRAADRERGSILTTCFRSLKWVNDIPMRKTLVKSDFNMSDIVSSGQQSLFIALPFDYMEESRQIRWMRVLVNLITVHLYRNPRPSDQPKLLMILDEFKQLGYMRMLQEGIVTARGAGAKYWILLQDIGQLKSNYKDSWQTFLGASNIQVFGVGNDPDTSKWTAEALGGLKESGSGSYPLLRPDEVKQFLGKEEPTQIIIRSTGAPMKLRRMAFKDIGKFKGLGLDKLED